MSKYSESEKQESTRPRDHGKPTHHVKWTDANGEPCEEWAYCPVCLTVKDGWFREGTPRFRGQNGPAGTLLIQYQLENGAKRTFLAACSCGHGLRTQERWEKIYKNPNAMLPFRAYKIGQKIKISGGGSAEIVDVLIPGEGKDVSVRRIGDGA